MTTENNLPNCWEIMNCGREEDGHKTHEQGECIASKLKLGHSCWAVAGTLCRGKVEGSVAKKIGFCTKCKVFKLYNQVTGTFGDYIMALYPEENQTYTEIMMKERDGHS